MNRKTKQKKGKIEVSTWSTIRSLQPRIRVSNIILNFMRRNPSSKNPSSFPTMTMIIHLLRFKITRDFRFRPTSPHFFNSIFLRNPLRILVISTKIDAFSKRVFGKSKGFGFVFGFGFDYLHQQHRCWAGEGSFNIMMK